MAPNAICVIIMIIAPPVYNCFRYRFAEACALFLSFGAIRKFMQRKVLEYRGPVDCADAAFLYEDVIHTCAPFVLHGVTVNAENAQHMESIFRKKTYIIETMEPPAIIVYSSDRSNLFPGRAVHFSEGQDPMDRRVEIMDASRHNSSIDFWKLHISLPVTRERAIHAMKIGENAYEITLEAGSRRDLARIERLLYDTLDEEAA